MYEEVKSETAHGLPPRPLIESTPGFAWSVEKPGAGGREGLGGFAVLEPEQRPVADDTLFDLASLTKPLSTALLALLARDSGEIDLDEPVAGATPHPFTMLELLRHQAGFPSWLPLYGKVKKSEGVFKWLLEECPRGEPGRKVAYSCLGYILLGLLLEERLKGTLDELFYDRVLGRLNIPRSDALFKPGPKEKRRCAATELKASHEAEMARQYGTAPPSFRNGTAWGEVHDGNARFMSGVAGNAGLFATLDGVRKLCGAFHRDAGLLSTEALDLAWTSPHPTGGVRRTAGWKATDSQGWWTASVLPEGSVGHEGFTGTGAWMAKGGEETYILLTNRIHPLHPGDDFGSTRAAFVKAARRLQ